MTILDDIQQRFRPRHTDVIGLDVGTSGVKAVRVKKVDNAPCVVAADILPAVPAAASAERAPTSAAALNLPKALKAKYASLALTGADAVVKLMTFPGHFDEAAEAQVTDSLGLKDAAGYRIAYRTVNESRTESRVLAVAVPDDQARGLCQLLPMGIPAPCSIEVAGLASMTAFLQGPGAAQPEAALGVIDFGSRVSFVAYFNRGVLCFVRKLDIGISHIVDRVRIHLGVDAAIAEMALWENSIDVSQSMTDVLGPFIRQTVTSRDFVERREDCRIGGILACGGGAASGNWLRHMSASLGVPVTAWNPFEGMAVLPDAIPEALKGQESRLTAALGAALATLEAQ